MLKIGWHSNSVMVGTGYGVQSAVFIPRIMSLGHDVIHSGFYGIQGSPLKMDDLMILPASKDPYGNDVLIEDFKYWDLDITITLIDAWIFNPQATSAIRWVPWFPVDCDPMPPVVADILRTAYRPIVYAKFGAEKAAEAGIKVAYVPHGVDTEYYHPLDQMQARRDLGSDENRLDWFIVSIVAANKGFPSRKCFDQQIRAFAEFHKAYPKSILALHTDVWGGHDGENIGRIIQLAGLDMDCVALPPKYKFIRGMLGPEYLRNLYSASDVLLNATRGEGFGVPIIEAQSCGTPAIVTNFSAMPELIDAGAGWKVPIADKFFYQNSYQAIPSVKGIVDALSAAYEAKQSGELAKMGAQSRTGMVASYDANMITEKYWKPVLAEIETEIRAVEAKKAARAQQRAALRANDGPAPVGQLPAIGAPGPENLTVIPLDGKIIPVGTVTDPRPISQAVVIPMPSSTYMGDATFPESKLEPKQPEVTVGATEEESGKASPVSTPVGASNGVETRAS